MGGGFACWLNIFRFYCSLSLPAVSVSLCCWSAPVLGPRSKNKEKSEAYECGFEAFEDARMQFDVRYYLIAILFILFDLEIAFLFPWAVVFKQIGLVALVEMAMFLALLLLGFVYCWKKGALEWE